MKTIVNELNLKDLEKANGGVDIIPVEPICPFVSVPVPFPFPKPEPTKPIIFDPQNQM